MTWFLDKPFLENLDLEAYEPEMISQFTGVSLEVASAFVDTNRTYWVETNKHYGFLAGVNENRRPCLVFIGRPRISSEAIHDLNIVSFEQNWELRTMGVDLPAEAGWDDILGVAQEAVGFVHLGRCPTRAFKHPDMWHCAIVPFPFYMHEDIYNEPADVPDVARSWIENENYVLHWGNAYYMSKDGLVESS